MDTFFLRAFITNGFPYSTTMKPLPMNQANQPHYKIDLLPCYPFPLTKSGHGERSSAQKKERRQERVTLFERLDWCAARIRDRAGSPFMEHQPLSFSPQNMNTPSLSTLTLAVSLAVPAACGVVLLILVL
jgi:hypothetical protein